MGQTFGLYIFFVKGYSYNVDPYILYRTVFLTGYDNNFLTFERLGSSDCHKIFGEGKD